MAIENIRLFEALVGHPSVEMVRFGDTLSSDELFAKVGNVVDTVPTLIDLDINYFTISNFPSEFTLALKRSKTLQRLTFYECTFTAESCASLCDILVRNKYLQFLDIGNLIVASDESDESYNKILNIIPSNSTLNYLLPNCPHRLISFRNVWIYQY